MTDLSLIPPSIVNGVQYQSHLAPLMACLAATRGPVLEVGVGYFSTPILHAFCGAADRLLVSVESDEGWMNRFKHYEGFRHHFHINYNGLAGSVALIDHSPGGENRAKAFRYLIDRFTYVVMHDAQKDAENFQAVEPLLIGVRWHLCDEYFPHTLVASAVTIIPAVLTAGRFTPTPEEELRMAE